MCRILKWKDNAKINTDKTSIKLDESTIIQ